jgi:putative two-component system response regulator
MAESKETILIVDDEKVIRSFLCEALAGEGYLCLEASDAQQALDHLEANPVDVVLLDIKMPGKSGFDLLLESRVRYPDMAVIMASGISDIDTAIECVRQGAYDYLTKPFTLNEVIHVVRRAVDKIRLQRELSDYRQRLELKIEEQAERIRHSFLASMAALAFALEAKDPYTAGHSRRVAEISVAIGRRLNLGDDVLEDLHRGSLLHDIGKIAVNQYVLNKPGKLTEQEYQHVMSHTAVGTSIVDPIVNNRSITDIVELHHARYDGLGFRQKSKGKDIPFLARIVAVADAYDAMTSERTYRPALSREDALYEIRLGMGTQFDPKVASAFLAMSESDIRHTKKEILIADDEVSIRLLVRSALSDEFDVIEASNGLEAVKIAKIRNPSLILMDILMPKKDGLEACHEIKSMSTTKAIPVVMLTGIAHELDKKLCTQLGADAYVTKPFTPDQLNDVIESFLSYAPSGVKKQPAETANP